MWLRMEEPELVHCEVKDWENDIQPSPLPKREENISDSFIEMQNLPRRIPPPRAVTVTTYQRCRQNSSSKKQVMLSIILVAIFAILSLVFMTLYFTTEAKFRSCDGKKSLQKSHSNITRNYSSLRPALTTTDNVNVCQKYSIVNNCSENNNTSSNNSYNTGSEYSILFSRRNIKDYVISHSQPQMKAVTVCFWVKTTQSKGRSNYVSYASSSDNNEIRVYDQTLVYFWIRDPKRNGYRQNVINDGKWHSICCLWSSQSGEYKIYKDGELVNKGTGYKKGHTIPGRGTWVLGQDQDKPGGGFQVGSSFEGEITEVNVWNKELSLEQITEFSTRCQCKFRGNVRSWDDFRAGAKGDVKIVTGPTCSNV